jgi:hypothetical protein
MTAIVTEVFCWHLTNTELERGAHCSACAVCPQCGSTHGAAELLRKLEADGILTIVTVPDDLADTSVDPVRGDDFAKLCLGEQVTTCCGAFATFSDTTLCCKACWREVGHGA